MSLHAMLPDKTRVHAAEDELGGEQQMTDFDCVTDPDNAHPCAHACGRSAFGIGNINYCITSR